MGGRGRGGGGRGGRGGGPISQAKLLMQRSAVEAGLGDERQFSLQEITRPPLFPEINWPVGADGPAFSEEGVLTNTKRPASTVSLMNKHRELQERMQSSTHFVQPVLMVDVVRYGKRRKQSSPDEAILDAMSTLNRKLATDTRYATAELLFPEVSAKAAAAANNNLAGLKRGEETLEALALRERSAAGTASAAVPGEDEDLPEEVDEEEEEAEDYMVDHYASEDEGSDGDNGEATF